MNRKASFRLAAAAALALALPLLLALCAPAWTRTGETIDADDWLAAHR